MFRHVAGHPVPGPPEHELEQHSHQQAHSSSLASLMSLQSISELARRTRGLHDPTHHREHASAAYEPLHTGFSFPRPPFYKRLRDDKEEGDSVDSTRRNLTLWNSAACLVHFVMFIVILAVCGIKERFGLGFSLKRDSVLINNSTGSPPLGAGMPWGTESANFTAPGAGALVPVASDEVAGFPFFGGCLRNSTYYARPNELRWRREGEGALTMYTYARAIPGAWLSLPWLVACFFFLSFIFQIVVVTGWIWPIYITMFPSEKEDPPVSRTKSILTFNFLRYIEYSFSASLMIVIISLLAGITDQVRSRKRERERERKRDSSSR